VQTLSVVGLVGLAGVGYHAYHGQVTGQAIKALVPEWEVASVDPLPGPPMCAGNGGLVDNVAACIGTATVGGATVGFSLGEGGCVLLTLGSGEQTWVCSLAGVPLGLGGGAVGLVGGAVVCGGGEVVDALVSGGQWTREQIEDLVERSSQAPRPEPPRRRPPGPRPVGPTEVPGSLQQHLRARSQIHVGPEGCNGRDYIFNGVSGMDGLLRCANMRETGPDGNVLANGEFHPVFRQTLEDAIARRDGLSTAAKACIAAKGHSMINCGEKDAFDRALETCAVETEEDLERFLCGVRSWRTFYGPSESSPMQPCYQCCVFFDVLWDKVKHLDLKSCPGKDAVYRNWNARTCQSMRDAGNRACERPQRRASCVPPSNVARLPH
jgi:hypothetical protein